MRSSAWTWVFSSKRDRVGRRVDVEPDDLAQLGDEFRVLRQLEAAHPVRLQAAILSTLTTPISSKPVIRRLQYRSQYRSRSRSRKLPLLRRARISKCGSPRMGPTTCPPYRFLAGSGSTRTV